MARLNPPDRDKLPPNAQSAFDHIVDSRGHVSGPFTVLVHSPDLAKTVADVGAYVRFESGLSARVRCLAVMSVARSFNCRFEWAGWTKQAREAGVAEDVIQAIGDGRHPEGLALDEELAVRFGQQLLGPAHRVENEVYDAVVQQFGVEGAVDLAATYGYFSMLTFLLNAFEVDIPEGGDVLHV